MNQYVLRQSVNLRVTFKVNNVLTDPATVTFKMRKPDGTETTYVYLTDVQLIRDSTGKYHVLVLLDQYGVWWYRYEGTGTAPGATEASLEVIPSQFYS
jgi:hypothetical protein